MPCLKAQTSRLGQYRANLRVTNGHPGILRYPRADAAWRRGRRNAEKRARDRCSSLMFSWSVLKRAGHDFLLSVCFCNPIQMAAPFFPPPREFLSIALSTWANARCDSSCEVSRAKFRGSVSAELISEFESERDRRPCNVHSLRPELLDFMLFGKAILAANRKLGLFLNHQLRK